MVPPVTEGGLFMLDFNRIVDEVCSLSGATARIHHDARGEAEPVRPGITKTASRNHYEWALPNGMRTGDRVRLDDGREGALTAPFPGCRGDGDWCGIFLDDGSEENIRPDRVASVFGRKAADDALAPAADQGRSVRYIVEFSGHGTDHMSAKMTKDAANSPGGEPVTAGHDRSAKLLQALVEFEANAAEAVASVL